ncbi:MAG TPA: Vms1/Ankzf1 family peptidyl-tRNA hydrolase [Actinomycetota bacterium]
MADLDRTFLRELAHWEPDGVPVTTVYLGVDGRSMPRKQDYELRLEDLLRRVRDQAAALAPGARRSVERDAGRAREFVRESFVRAGHRGLAVFSAFGAGLWETVAVSRPVPNRAVVAPHPDLAPLDWLLHAYESFCTVLVDSARARFFLAELGRIEERSDLDEEHVRRHDQGGWAQARLQRHADDLRRKHLRRTAEALFEFSQRRPFDHLILAGPEEVVTEFERELHHYLLPKVRDRVSLPVTATANEVLQRSLALEEEMVAARQSRVVERLAAEGPGGGAVSGLTATLTALSDGRAETLVVADGLAEPGVECPECGGLGEWGEACRTCGAPTRRIPDVVEAAVARAFRSGCRVEMVAGDRAVAVPRGIGAILRF